MWASWNVIILPDNDLVQSRQEATTWTIDNEYQWEPLTRTNMI